MWDDEVGKSFGWLEGDDEGRNDGTSKMEEESDGRSLDLDRSKEFSRYVKILCSAFSSLYSLAAVVRS